MAQYRNRPVMIENLRKMISDYTDKVRSDVGTIGRDVTIADAGYIKNVRVGDFCKIEGASKLKNGSINSNQAAPVHIGVGVVAEDFIISSGSSVEDGVTLSRCFVGQACTLGHNYSASDSLFFSNCQGENGEACAIFAGPYTVTHHKSTLLIAGMFSFMNAGSGSNQSNHMYKLGPIHHGKLERGAKTASDSYILWPAKVGAFSLVMGRHVNNADTSNLPFSYLIEQQNTTYLVPGVNLRSVGTIRDAQKWPKRDKRTDSYRLDQINYNLLSPYTIQKMMKGCQILKDLRRVSGETSETYSYQSAKIKNSSLNKGIQLLDSGHNNSRCRIFKLFFEDFCTLVAVSCTFFKAIILFDGLVVQVLAVNDKQNLVNILQVCSKLRSFERCKSFTTSGSVPDVTSGVNRSGFLAVVRCLYSIQNTLCGNDLIRTHDQQ
jgi:hypothetical protein